MLGDPKECRLRARQCLLMANRAASPQEQRTFERIHRSWNRLAVEIESAQALMATSRATELTKSLAPNPGKSVRMPARSAIFSVTNPQTKVPGSIIGDC
jgi:ferric-dicitrate binding protein FerR (iron transport regulator)